MDDNGILTNKKEIEMKKILFAIALVMTMAIIMVIESFRVLDFQIAWK